MARGTLEAVSDDAKTLHDWLRRDRGLRLADVDLPGAPEFVQALWKHVGWTDAFARDLELVHPSEASGMAMARDILTRWHEEDRGGFPLDRLPSKFRMVSVEPSGEGFVITDESKPGPTPPLLGVVRDRTSGFVAIRESYVKYVGSRLLGRAMIGMYRTSLVMGLEDASQLGGTPLLGTLVPSFRRVDERVLLFEKTRRGKLWDVGVMFETWPDLCEWLAGLRRVKRLHVPMTALTMSRPRALLEPLVPELEVALVAPSVDDPKERAYIGQLDGHWVSLETGPVNWVLVMDPADRGVFDALRARGLPPNLESSAPTSPHPVVATGRGPTAKALSQAARTLAEVVAELRPEHARQRRDRTPDAGAPKAVSVLVEAIGSSPVVDPLLPLDREASAARLRSILERWMARPYPRDVWQHRSGDDVLGHLPGAVRLLGYHGFADERSLPDERIEYLDESVARLDPVVLGRAAGSFAAAVIDPRASNFLAQRVLAGVGRGRVAKTYVDVGEYGEPIIGVVCRGIVRLGPGVFGNGEQVYFANDTSFGAWLATLTVDRLANVSPPAKYPRRRLVRAKRIEPRALEKVEGFRTFVSPGSNPSFPFDLAHGLISGWPVWISKSGRHPATIQFPSAGLAAVEAWVDVHGSEMRAQG